MKSLEKQVKYVDIKTGEVVMEKKKYVDSKFDEENGYLFWNRKSHNKIYHDIKFPPDLNWKDKGRLHELSLHIWSNTNILAYRGNGGVKPYNLEQIGDIIELKDRQLRSFMHKMIKNIIIAKSDLFLGDNKLEHYYMNPVYFFSGSRIPLNLYIIFKQSLDYHLPEWVVNKFMTQKNT